MGIFSLTQELAIDLGTANTLIIYNGKVVVDEPSIVALDVHTGKLVAIGHQAHQMHERTNPNIKTIRPLKDILASLVSDVPAVLAHAQQELEESR